MADTDDPKDTKNYHLDVPVESGGFHVRGARAYDWGMQNRLSRIFRPELGPDGDAGDRPRLLPGPDHRARAGRRQHRARSSATRTR